MIHSPLRAALNPGDRHNRTLRQQFHRMIGPIVFNHGALVSAAAIKKARASRTFPSGKSRSGYWEATEVYV